METTTTTVTHGQVRKELRQCSTILQEYGLNVSNRWYVVLKYIFVYTRDRIGLFSHPTITVVHRLREVPYHP